MLNSEDSPTYGSSSPSAHSYVELDLPGLSGSSPPLNLKNPAQPNLVEEVLKDRQQYATLPRMPYEIQGMSSTHNSFNSQSIIQDPGLTLSERHYSDKFNLIKQRQQLIKEKQEELKLLKQQRRLSCHMNSPNNFQTHPQGSGPTQNDVESFNQEVRQPFKITKDNINNSYMHSPQTQSSGSYSVDPYEHPRENDPQENSRDSNNPSKIAPSLSYQNIRQFSAEDVVDESNNVYPTLDSRKSSAFFPVHNSLNTEARSSAALLDDHTESIV